MYNIGWAKSRRALDCFLYLWLKVWEGIDKYWIVPVRKLFYCHHCLLLMIPYAGNKKM